MDANYQVSLADGPVGRLALATRALAVTGRAASLDYSLRLFTTDGAAILGNAVDDITANPLLQQSFCDSSLLVTVGEITSGYHHGYSMLGQRGLNVLRDLRPQLDALEGILQQSGAHEWWWGPLSKNQVITQTAEGVRLDLDTPQYDTGSAWWTPPHTRSTVMTTRGPVAYQDPNHSTTTTYPSVAAVTGEDLAVDNPRTKPFTTPEGAVYEIDGPQAFVELVEHYPHQWVDSYGEWEKMTGGHGPWVGPDWQAVASDFVGVHLNVAAYLSTAYRALNTQAGTAVLAGWDPDATVWFNQVASVAWLGEDGPTKSARR